MSSSTQPASLAPSPTNPTTTTTFSGQPATPTTASSKSSSTSIRISSTSSEPNLAAGQPSTSSTASSESSFTSTSISSTSSEINLAAGQPSTSITTLSESSSTSISISSTLIPTSVSTVTASGVLLSSTTEAVANATAGPSPRQSTKGLSNGAVAGSVVGVALALAFLTFLATYFFMRLQKRSSGSGGRRQHRRSKHRGVAEECTLQEETELKGPSVVEHTTQPGTLSSGLEDYLPQAADDKTVRTNISTTLEHLEMHVENFYQHSFSSDARMAEMDVARFNSPHLPGPLASLLPQSKNRVVLIKHCLTNFTISSITATGDPGLSLLPPEFVLLPSLVSNSKMTIRKAGFSQTFSQWRVLTTYLRPSPSDDASYITQRDQAINEAVHKFCRAFTPWKKAEHNDETRARSLTEILKGAAELGIWLFSQPCTIEFRWPNTDEVGGKVLVGPEVVKMTDEKGRRLGKAQQVMVKWATQ